MRDENSFLNKVSGYFQSVWNQFDLLVYMIFIVSIILRFAQLISFISFFFYPQICMRDENSFLNKVSGYFQSVWNQFDLLVYMMFIVSIILRFAQIISFISLLFQSTDLHARRELVPQQGLRLFPKRVEPVRSACLHDVHRFHHIAVRSHG